MSKAREIARNIQARIDKAEARVVSLEAALRRLSESLWSLRRTTKKGASYGDLELLAMFADEALKK